MVDELGDRMKMLEKQEASRKFLPLLPICVRLDGKNFSNYTKGLERPYDKRLSDIMIATTKALVAASNAVVGYTQSDEISLVLYSDDYQKQVYFDGKIQKLVSVLGSIATAVFNDLTKELLPEKQGVLAYFDCRAWTVPNKMEAVNTLVWRELDATKNSVSMATRCYYSHKAMMNKRRADQMNMLMEAGVNWNDYPTFFKRGTYVKRQTVKVMSELLKNYVYRSAVLEYNIPTITKIANKVEVIFDGEAAVLKEN